MSDTLEATEASLQKAVDVLAPLDKALFKAQRKREADDAKNRAAVKAIIAERDTARLEVMRLENRVAELKVAAGLQAPTQKAGSN